MRKIISLAITILLILSAVSVHAIDNYGGYPVPVDIAVNGSFIKCSQKPIMVNNRTYIPLRALADAIGASISWDGNTRAATMTKSNHTFVFHSGWDNCTIDGVKKNYPTINHKDLLFVPVRAISETLGYGVEWDDFYLTVKINAPSVSVPQSCIDYSYSYEDIMYLSKITHIESGSLEFRTRVGVANTVINRVHSSNFPNNIKDVIFDTKHSTQFPPAHTEKFNNTPSKQSVMAAKCALNGINLVGNSLYFVDVIYQSGSWVHNNKTLYVTLGSMAFYQ